MFVRLMHVQSILSNSIDYDCVEDFLILIIARNLFYWTNKLLNEKKTLVEEEKKDPNYESLHMIASERKYQDTELCTTFQKRKKIKQMSKICCVYTQNESQQ